jgi:NADH-quinone oxidoreductase subunit G
MVQLEVDGKPVEVPDGSMVMQAADKLGITIPHFCYHKKLSIAANCRMCLVDVEKAPKPMPACATPVTNGMKVWTASEKAVKAQKAVMEFLLINHPLDCPICDQGGECLLQDLAVGYGGSASRYTEEKRVVFHKNLGPLVSAEEMSRCIHCTRCVRFGQEVAGVMELGMVGRGEHSEIVSFVGRSIDSELSGNMIDVCPVGALTSKPFRYSARTWELARRKTIAPHDSLGSNIIAQVKANQVLRVVPLEEESINECWISDRDRFSYEGLNAAQRLRAPMLKQDGRWIETDWQTALEYAATSLKTLAATHGAQALGFLSSGQSTLEELVGLKRLADGLGSPNIDFRPRLTDGVFDAHREGAPWLGMPVADLNDRDVLLIVGSFLRKDHPLLASRIRQAVKRGTRVAIIHAVDDDLLMPLAAKAIIAPSQWAHELARCTEQVGMIRNGEASTPGVAALLAASSRGAVLLGNAVIHHPAYLQIMAAAQALARSVGATLGVLGDAANSVGGYIAGATPGPHGLNAGAMIDQPRQGYLLLNLDPQLDHAGGALALDAVRSAACSIALTPFATDALLDACDCLLPISPFTETSGTFINTEGRAQSFQAVNKPLGQTRPGWKVLRVLGSMLGLSGFEIESSEGWRDAVLTEGWASKLSNAVAAPVQASEQVRFETLPLLERIAEVPIYATDMIVRHADSLQKTNDAKSPALRLHPETARDLGLVEGELAHLSDDEGRHRLAIDWRADPTVAVGVLRLPAAHWTTSGLPATTTMVRVHAPALEA